MTYKRFEDLPVWKAAIELAERVLQISTEPACRGKGDLGNQLQRAAISISNNIAEGFERGTTTDLLTFIYYARGSAGEVRSMLHLMDRVSDLSHLKSQISNLKSDCESIARQLRAWADFLQNSDIKGQRHPTDKVRADQNEAEQSKAFWAQIDAVMDNVNKRWQQSRI